MSLPRAEVPKPKGVAILTVFDSLFAKTGAGMSGATTYEGLSRSIDDAVADGYETIGFYIDSPGGEAFGLFSLMGKIRNLKAQGIRTFAFTDGMATSAAYGIAAAVETFYATPLSVVGSIAAVSAHVEVSQRDAKEGVVWTIFRSKEEKALGDAHTPLSDEVRAKFEAHLATVDSLFNNEVLEGQRNLTLEKIIEMKGSEFMAEEAMTLGLVDQLVMDLPAALQDFCLACQPKPKPKKPGVSMESETTNPELVAATIIQANLLTEAQRDEAVKLAVSAERARVLSLCSNAQSLGFNLATVQRHIERGYTVDASLEIMTDIRAERERDTAINTTTSASTSTAQDDLHLEGRANLRTSLAKARGRTAA
jgi:ClpP class serine protease